MFFVRIDRLRHSVKKLKSGVRVCWRRERKEERGERERGEKRMCLRGSGREAREGGRERRREKAVVSFHTCKESFDSYLSLLHQFLCVRQILVKFLFVFNHAVLFSLNNECQRWCDERPQPT